MKFKIKTDLLNNGRHRWQVLESATGYQVVAGEHDFPGQARHDAMEARRALKDNPPLEQAVYDLYHLEDVVTGELTDVVEKVEEEVRKSDGRFDDYAEQDDGTKPGILFWENACPELDSARSMIQDAYAAITDFLETEENQDG